MPTATARRRAPRGSSGSASTYSSVSAPGISEDVALLLAFEKGAELIVAVGTHFNLIEFLERDRAGMSSTFVTRLKVGEILIDAKGVSRLVSRQVGLWPLVLFAAAGLGAVVVAIVASPGCGTSSACSASGSATCSASGSFGRVPTYTARKELLAPLEDVWLFLAEPHHLSDWWPGVGGVSPTGAGSRRPPLEAARADAARAPAPAGLGVALHDHRRRAAVPGHLVHDRRAAGRRAQARGRGRPPHERGADGRGPFMVGLRRSFPRTALNRLYALCQTAARALRCSTSATTSPRSRPSSSR